MNVLKEKKTKGSLSLIEKKKYIYTFTKKKINGVVRKKETHFCNENVVTQIIMYNMIYSIKDR